jgi:hypothetical protein
MKKWRKTPEGQAYAERARKLGRARDRALMALAKAHPGEFEELCKIYRREEGLD